MLVEIPQHKPYPEKLLSDYLNEIEKDDNHYTKLPSSDLVQITKELASSFREKFSKLFVIGIGGSSLGAKAIYSVFERWADRSLFFLESTNPETLSSIDASNDACMVIISKSGKTVETISLFSYMASLFNEKGISWRERSVVITSDIGKNPLKKISLENDIPLLPIPPTLPGRYSVFSPVGLFPLYFSGIDVDGLLKGSVKGFREITLDGNGPKLASFLHGEWERGRHIIVNFSYSERLFYLLSWLSQLIAESLGKGGKGFTPLSSIGPQDQHSMLQLYFDGPDDKIYFFLTTRNFLFDAEIPNAGIGNISYGAGRKFSELLLAEEEGTRRSLIEKGRPVARFLFEGPEPEEIGYFMAIWEVAVPLLARLMGVNPYTQDGVELGKRITRSILEGKYGRAGTSY